MRLLEFGNSTESLTLAGRKNGLLGREHLDGNVRNPAKVFASFRASSFVGLPRAFSQASNVPLPQGGKSFRDTIKLKNEGNACPLCVLQPAGNDKLGAASQRSPGRLAIVQYAGVELTTPSLSLNTSFLKKRSSEDILRGIKRGGVFLN